MTQKRVNRGTKEIKAMMAEDADFLRALVRTVIQEFFSNTLCDDERWLWDLPNKLLQADHAKPRSG